MLNSRAGDVDLQRRILWIGKDKAGRCEQSMPQVLAQYMGKVIKGMEAKAYLFPSQRAGSGRADQMNAVFGRCLQRAGNAKRVTPHTMSHIAATNAAHAGLDAATIQAMGGWKTRAMVERYTHAASMQDAMAALQKQLSGDAIRPRLRRRLRKAA